MLNTVRAIVRDGNIVLLEPVSLAEGMQVLVTVLSDPEHLFWQEASATHLEKVWDNVEDDVYAELLSP